jgi:hypothetical protein
MLAAIGIALFESKTRRSVAHAETVAAQGRTADEAKTIYPQGRTYAEQAMSSDVLMQGTIPEELLQNIADRPTQPRALDGGEPV